MKFVAAQEIRRGEAKAIAQHPGLDVAMMQLAGDGVAGAIASILSYRDEARPTVRFLAGPGNNGGDALCAAATLDRKGIRSEIWLAAPKDKFKGAARQALNELHGTGVDLREMAEGDWLSAAATSVAPAVLVDALLGTGATGEPRGAIRLAIDYLNALSSHCPIVAVDLPTGMNADTGECVEAAVRADVTVTMAYPKPGMVFADAQEYLGALWRVPIGLPVTDSHALADARPDLQWISEDDVRRILRKRARATHKGTYGQALLMGGSAQYPGAIVLAAQGAIRSGAGLVRVATTADAAPAVTRHCPEAILHGDVRQDVSLAGMNAILLGPGLGRDPEARRITARLLHETPCPLVLDADAIAVLSGKPEAIRSCPQPVILTPHPGELALLLDTDVATIQQDRLVAAQEAAERTGAIVVLKGSGTLVAQAGQPAWVNLNGNPGMACGGSGDVLAGLLAGLAAQSRDPLAAACTGVWLHGMAGDVAALRNTQAAMTAGDIARSLPAAFRRVSV